MSEGYGYQQPGYGQPGAPPSGQTSPPVDGGYAAPEPAAHGKKKKRGYAAEAFDIGVGANTVPAAGVPPAQFGAAQPSYGYQQPAQATPAYGQPGPTAAYGAAPAYGLPTGPAAGAAYHPPTPGYGGAGVDGLTAGMSQMNMGGAPAGQPAAIPQAQAQTTQLNQLYPIDVQQPVRPEIIDFPPPPIILPAGVSVTQSATANCPHKYTRSTLNAIPATNKLLSKSKLPFALVIQPYGSLHDQSDPVPLVEDQTIARCRRCRTYINPFVTFMDQGHRWRCNMCNLTNDVPQAFDWDAASQKSVDRWKRHELNHAVMEFVAPQEYMVRPPQPLVYLFLIDVSYAAVASGLVATAAETIFASLDSIPNADQCTRLGFIAVDSSLHYFSIPTDHDAAEKDLDTKMMVVSDLDEPFMPVPDNLLAHLSTSRNSIEKFLNALPRMFQNNQNNGSCMGSAVVAGHKLISSLGGKLTVLTASLPSIGQGKLEMREDRKVFGTSKETGLLQTANNFYKSFAVECSKSQVCVDMFLFSSQYQDVASLSNLPRYTGGQTWLTASFKSAASVFSGAVSSNNNPATSATTRKPFGANKSLTVTVPTSQASLGANSTVPSTSTSTATIVASSGNSSTHPNHSPSPRLLPSPRTLSMLRRSTSKHSLASTLNSMEAASNSSILSSASTASVSTEATTVSLVSRDSASGESNTTILPPSKISIPPPTPSPTTSAFNTKQVSASSGKASTDDRYLHNQIEDLLAALTQLQLNHAILSSDLERERDEREEDKRAVQSLLAGLRHKADGVDEMETGTPTSEDLFMLLDAVEQRFGLGEGSEDAEAEGTGTQKKSLGMTKADLEDELRAATDKAAAAASQNQNLTRQIHDLEQDVSTLREQLKESQGRVRTMHQDKQRVEKQMQTMRQSRSPTSPISVTGAAESIRSVLGVSISATEEKPAGGLRELRLGRGPPSPSVSSGPSFSRRGSAMRPRDSVMTLSAAAAQGEKPTSEHDALLLELVQAKTGEAMAKAEVEELKQKLDSLKKQYGGLAPASAGTVRTNTAPLAQPGAAANGGGGFWGGWRR